MREAGKYLRDGLLRLNATLRLHPRPSTSLPPPLCSRRRYEKVIMFPLEMTRSPSAPFISKWNNLSTVAFFFFSLHLHLSFLYTTPAPLFLSFTSLYFLLFLLFFSIVSHHTHHLLCKVGIKCVYEEAFFLSRVAAFYITFQELG